MILKGTTTTGFEFEIPEEMQDDWELFEMLREVDKGNMGIMVDVAYKLLGDEQLARLKEHVKEKHGHVSTAGMGAELAYILEGNESTKNL